MGNKDDIRNRPWLLFVYTLSTYFNKELCIKIELKDKTENLFICDLKYFLIGKGERRNIFRKIEFNKDGISKFNGLTPTFGKVWVYIPGKEGPIFNSYNEFIAKIMP